MVTTAPLAHRTAAVAMDTLISIEVVAAAPTDEVQAVLDRALNWFVTVEQACSRFDPASEVYRLIELVGQAVPASPVLFEAAWFALALAERTGGAFDPTVGHRLEARGFNQHYLTRERIRSPIDPAQFVSYRDVRLDPVRRTIELRRPLVLDLGAVAKGLAIDLAARELAGFEHICIEAGGDLYARGHSPAGAPWRIGVQDPNDPAALVYRLEVADHAVCTSGGYERPTADGRGHHLIDPRTGRSARSLASVTVIAPTAMAADGLATAAFILGPERGRRLLELEDVGGILVTPSGDMRLTRALKRENA